MDCLSQQKKLFQIPNLQICGWGLLSVSLATPAVSSAPSALLVSLSPQLLFLLGLSGVKSVVVWQTSRCQLRRYLYEELGCSKYLVLTEHFTFILISPL